jgi:mono/diheme cytochrome c family protein
MKYLVVGFMVVGVLVIGVNLGRVSVDRSVPLLPTLPVATPENYIAQLTATPGHYGFVDVTRTPMPRVFGSIAEGKLLYETYCAHCHGYTGGGEPGEPNPNVPDELGFMLVPRHDSFGHTWLHPDPLLIAVIKSGSMNPLFRQPMPAFNALLNDEQINNILDYIKLWWTDEQREHQVGVTTRFQLARDNP